MAKYKYVPIDIYKRGFIIFVGNHSEFKDWCTDYYKNDSAYNELVEIVLDSDGSAQASYWYNNNDGCGIIEIPKLPRTPKEIAYCAHECLHTVFHTLDFVGVNYIKHDSNEAFTYLLEHIIRNLLETENYKQV